MAQADGYIVIDTEINADGMKAGSKEVEAAVEEWQIPLMIWGIKLRQLSTNKRMHSKLNNEYAAQEQKVSELKKKDC